MAPPTSSSTPLECPACETDHDICGTHRARPGLRETLAGCRPADPMLPLSTGEAVVRDLGPTCRRVMVQGAGHVVIQEAPDVVVDVPVEFLA